MNRIKDNLESVRERIALAAQRAGRKAEDIKLVAVTKTVGLPEIHELYEQGIRDFGENRVEVALGKISVLESEYPDINWHFIGHLQRNKAKKIADKVFAVHSVESAGLLNIIQKMEVQPQVYLEVNVSGEKNKYGLEPMDVSGVLAEYSGKIAIRGLMTMAPFYAEPEDTRPVFAGLCALRDKVVAESGFNLPYLSMGMSNDFEIAIEEGATHVRVGSELFR